MSRHPLFGLCLCLTILLPLAGCSRGFDQIDQRVDHLLGGTSAAMGGDAIAPQMERLPDENPLPTNNRNPDWAAERLATRNRSANELIYEEAQEEAQTVIDRLDAYAEPPPDPLMLDLATALQIATEIGREHEFAEESYILSALDLLVERHRWGPRFFNTTTAEITGDGDDGLFDTALQVVNDFGVTHRLPYGGVVSARALARASEDLHERVAGEDTQSTEILLSADIPLLRGAGISAREARIQAERDVVYAARGFERFRREFVVDIADEFLNLVVLQQRILNNMRQVESLQEVEERERALYEAGRNTLFEASQAENATVEAIDRLNQAREQYRLAVDRFKVRLGLPTEEEIVIVPSSFDLPVPHVNPDEAVQAAFLYRLDLQTERDMVDDARRSLHIARNALLPGLDLSASVNVPTDPDRDHGGVDFDPGSSSFSAGVTFDAPLDREIERMDVRAAQINLERAVRNYTQFRDTVAIEVRSAVRTIDRSLFSLRIQEQNIEIARQRLASIEADPTRATVRDRTEAVNQLQSAEDARDSARRDLEIAILNYLLDTGQLRVENDGYLRPLRGMYVAPRDQADPDALPPALLPNEDDDAADAIPVEEDEMDTTPADDDGDEPGDTGLEDA